MIALFAQAPALPLHAAGKYVAGAYIVFLLVVLIYVAIMATRLGRNQKELAELRAMVEQRDREDTGPTPSPAQATEDSMQSNVSEPVA